MLETFDQQVAEAKAVLAGIAPEKWNDNWKFVAGGQAWINESKYEVWRNWVLNHQIHHRAQLGVYLRLLNKPIPGMYGPLGGRDVRGHISVDKYPRAKLGILVCEPL